MKRTLGNLLRKFNLPVMILAAFAIASPAAVMAQSRGEHSYSGGGSRSYSAGRSYSGGGGQSYSGGRSYGRGGGQAYSGGGITAARLCRRGALCEPRWRLLSAAATVAVTVTAMDTTARRMHTGTLMGPITVLRPATTISGVAGFRYPAALCLTNTNLG